MDIAQVVEESIATATNMEVLFTHVHIYLSILHQTRTLQRHTPKVHKRRSSLPPGIHLHSNVTQGRQICFSFFPRLPEKTAVLKKSHGSFVALPSLFRASPTQQLSSKSNSDRRTLSVHDATHPHKLCSRKERRSWNEDAPK